MTVGNCRKNWRCLLKNLTNSSGKFGYFYKKLWQFLQQNLTSFARMRIIVMKNMRTSRKEELADFTAKIIKFSWKIVRCSCKDRQTFVQKSSEFLGKPLNFPVKVGGFSWKKSSNFLVKIITFSRNKNQIFSQKLSNFSDKIINFT